MNDKKFLFSVVMPVYNVEKYLEESIESLIAQTIGFRENIELILVNDGSPDDSDKICEKYAKLYPENIVYIYQENAGVSAARNRGLEKVRGKYVNFLDSDDKWDECAFEKALDFFKEYGDEVDVVSGAIQNFESSDKAHVTNYRHEKGSRVADLNDPKEHNSVVLQVASSFFKAEAIENVRFVEGLRYGEDSLFVNEVILEKMKVGFKKSAVYFYRRRESSDSAVQTINKSRYYYIDRLEKYHLGLIELSRRKYGKVVRYIQNVIYYDFGWHLYHNVKEILSPEDFKLFKKLSKKILKSINDKVIVGNVIHTPMMKKSTAMRLKYGEETFLKGCTYDESNNCLYYGKKKLFKFSNNKYVCNIYFSRIEKGELIIEGNISAWALKLTENGTELYAKIGSKMLKPQMMRFVHAKIETCFGESDRVKRFRVKVPVKDVIGKNKKVSVSFFLRFGEEYAQLGLNYGKFVADTNAFSESYKFYGMYRMECTQAAIKIKEYKSRASKILYILNKEERVKKALKKLERKDIAEIRSKYFSYKKSGKIKEKIWIISDRVENAGDNGEVFFKHLCENKPEGVRPIFAISKNAACVDRLKSIGEVVFFEDEEYLMYFLFAEKIISSGASDFTMNPFGNDRKYFIDLFNFKYYYLQHGVACADLSVWLNRFYKNIYRIFASSERERQAFIDSPYYYGEQKIVVTGQTRFDALYDEKEKLILVLPTWRKSIKESYDINTTSVYFDGFKDTEYFKFYNNLINDERLLEVMRKHGYKGLFCMHPIHKEQTIDYTENDVFKVNQGYVDYNDVFARAALTLTDYSSVIFDFAYLKKSIVYTQFDKEDFFAGQIYDEGYFSYENDGFGPVCYDYESTVDALIKAVERDCVNEEKYLDRISSFFTYDDKNNSARALEEIINS